MCQLLWTFHLPLPRKTGQLKNSLNDEGLGARVCWRLQGLRQHGGDSQTKEGAYVTEREREQDRETRQRTQERWRQRDRDTHSLRLSEAARCLSLWELEGRYCVLGQRETGSLETD